MSEDDADLWQLAITFAVLSVFALGGVTGLFAEMHRQAVDVHGWMTTDRFTDLFAIGQAAPGPNMLVVSLIGWDVAELPGAVTATAAMCGPSAVLAYFVGHWWEKFRRARWRVVLQAALVPVTIGLLASSAYLLVRATVTSPVAAAIAAAAAAGIYFTGRNPLLFLAGGALVGALGLV